jgi:hypothetical protein
MQTLKWHLLSLACLEYLSPNWVVGFSHPRIALNGKEVKDLRGPRFSLLMLNHRL